MNILDYQNYFLVGIKGVAMTSLAQCLVDAGKNIFGSDVDQNFVTKKLLDALPLKEITSFDAPLPSGIDCLIYTSAHQADQNPHVQAALANNIPIFSQAEAVASLFNQKKGIAVCGVGGKSTTSAMITWILEKTGRRPSFSVGVGNIPGLDKTGQWREESKHFVIEADEYVTDPAAPSKGEEIKARFSYLKPQIIVCTNLRYDHPDVYADFDQTKQVYGDFFANLPDGGKLIISENDQHTISELPAVKSKQLHLQTFGEDPTSTIRLTSYESREGATHTSFEFENKTYQLTMKIPGKYNVMNAFSAILACHQAGISIPDATTVLSDFRSTMRRFEYVGEKHGVKYYDDYAHHPHEIFSVIKALNEWYPENKKVIAFQSHTYSRTKALFDEFVDSFADADQVVMIDIFSSAREKADPSITSDKLSEAIRTKYPSTQAENLGTIDKLAEFCRSELKPGDVFMTVGAGDIYEVHELLT